MYPQSTKVPRTCATCGAEFLAYQSRPERKFCGRDCYQRHFGSPESRFWSRVLQTDRCWFWTGQRDSDGYGVMTINGRPAKAHRFSWTLHCGPIPEGMCVLHNCPGGDNRACVNPLHLWLGSPIENAADRDLKGMTLQGAAHRRAKLSEADVLEIRSLFETGRYTKVELGRQFGVTDSQIRNIVQRRLWRHI